MPPGEAAWSELLALRGLGSGAEAERGRPPGPTKEVLGFTIDFLDFNLDFLGFPILLLGFPRIS